MRDPGTGGSQYFLGLNFGDLEIDWVSQRISVSIVSAVDGQPRLRQGFSFQELDMKTDGEAVGVCRPERGPEVSLWRGKATLLVSALVFLIAPFALAVLILLRFAFALICRFSKCLASKEHA